MHTRVGTDAFSAERGENSASGAFEAAAMFWGGGYDSRTETITEGPFSVQIPQAIQASERPYRAHLRRGSRCR